MIRDKADYKNFLLKVYFPQRHTEPVHAINFQLNKKERPLLKLLSFPEKLYATYYLVAEFGDGSVSQKKIVYGEKDAVKYFIKLINAPVILESQN